jgi:Peptidase A4 family
MRLPRCIIVSGTAAVVAGTLMLAGEPPVRVGPGPIGAAAAHAARGGGGAGAEPHGPSAAFLAAARVALIRHLRQDRPQVSLVRRRGSVTPRGGVAPGGPEIGTSRITSYNWSGYADVSATNQTFARVSGQWRTPRVTCGSEDTITSEWVGLDGFSSLTVEQAGTVGWCFEGTPTYFTWYEMYPAGTVEVGTSLQAGDMITAMVSRSGTAYTLALTDATRPADSFSARKTCALAACLDTSAEWVAERPSFHIGIAPLADYSRWTVRHATQTASGPPGPISGYPASYQINMMDATGSYQLSTTSQLAGGRSFSTYWLNSY